MPELKTNLKLLDYYTFTKIFYYLIWLNLLFKTFSMFRRMFFVLEKNIGILTLKLMVKNLYSCFYTKTQCSFILSCRAVAEKMDGGVGSLSKWNQENYWNMIIIIYGKIIIEICFSIGIKENFHYNKLSNLPFA